MSLQTADVLKVLQDVQKNGQGWISRCPAHLDRGKPNLTVSDSGGKALFHCFRGCSQDAVANEIKRRIDKEQRGGSGFEFSEAPSPELTPDKAYNLSMEKDVTPWAELLEKNAEAQQFLRGRYISMDVARSLYFGFRPNQFFRGRSCSGNCPSCGQHPALVIPTTYEGEVIGIKYRALNPPDSDHKWAMEKGSTTKILQYADLDPFDFISSEVIVTEGPLDAAMLLSQGYNAVAIPSASSLPKTPVDWALFQRGMENILTNYHRIVCLGDQTPDGREAMDRLRVLFGAGADRYPLFSIDAKDVTEAIQKDGPEVFKKDMDFLLDWVRHTRPIPRHETVRERFERFAQDSFFLFRHVADPLKAAAASLAELRLAPVKTIGGATNVPVFPEEVIVGSLGELAHALTDGTLIPPHFVFMSLLTLVGLYCSGKLRYPGEDLQPRLYLCLIGERGRTKKSTSMERSWNTLLPLLKDTITAVRSLGSGEGLVEAFCEEGAKEHILLWTDELHSLTKKIGIEHSSLGQKCLELYEGNHISNRVKGNAQSSDKAHLAIITGTTPKGFEDAWVGTDADEGGLLSRFVIEHAVATTDKKFHLPSLDKATIDPITERIKQQLARLPLTLEIEPEATRKLEMWWQAREEKTHDARLDGFAKRTAMILALTSDKDEIDSAVVEAAIKLAERQSALRAEFFPADAKNIIERFEQKILDALQKKSSLSLRDLLKATNAHRPGSGGVGNFNRALQELMKSGTVTSIAKNQKGKQLYELARD